MEEIQGQIKSVHKLTAELTQYLCEDESKIKLDDILHTFKTFCLNLNQAVEVSAICVWIPCFAELSPYVPDDELIYLKTDF